MFHKTVMFFGSAAGQRVKPVSVMMCTIVKRPFLHPGSNAVGQFARDRLFVVDGINKPVECLFREILIHALPVEHSFCIILLRALFRRHYRHCLAVGSFLDRLESK